MKDRQLSDIEKLAISLVGKEKTQWEDATVFITEKVAFQCRNLIRQCRKNWWGIFDVPVDPTTGRKKTWVPLTESTGETCIKNVDVDTKHISFLAKRFGAERIAKVVRSLVKNDLDKRMFGELLDGIIFRAIRDGTAVWKTIRNNGKIDVLDVDVLNVYIDPTAKSIQDAYRLTERALMFPDEIKQMNGWINTDVQGTEGLSPTESGKYGSNSNVKAADVWESYGKYPKFLLTGKKKDMDIEVDIRIVVSGLDTPGKETVHLIEAYDGLKPYEELWYSRVPGRWYGKGIPEKLLVLQSWLNTIVNIRINRSYIAQAGLFLIRKGSGITPQTLSRLPANGAVIVNSTEDIQQLVMQEASNSSYKDEENAVGWSQRVTSAYETVTGEKLPAETSATATAIQSRSASSQFELVKEQIGMFLTRWLRRHYIPELMKTVKRKDVIRLFMDSPEDVRAWDTGLVNQLVCKKLDDYKQQGRYVDPLEVYMERDRLLGQLQTGELRMSEIDMDIDFLDYDVQINITNESVDQGVISQNLLTSLQAAPEYRDQILQMLFDQMGLSFKPLQQSQSTQPGQPGQPTQQPPVATPPSQSGADLITRANTLTNQTYAR